MKIILIALTVLFSLGAHAKNGVESQVACEFPAGHDIKRVIIQSGEPGNIRIHSKGTHFEKLLPEEGRGGVFGQLLFPATIEHKNDGQRIQYAQVTSRQLGTIKIAYTCNRRSSQLCDFRDGSTTKTSRVTFNIDGEVLKFNGRDFPVCTRTVIQL